MQDVVPTSGERDMAMFCHFAGLAAFTSIPFAGIVAPLVLWLMKRDESDYIYYHGREVVNFQISMHIYLMISIFLAFFIIGFFLIIGILIMMLACSITGAIKAKDGEYYAYPMTINFLN